MPFETPVVDAAASRYVVGFRSTTSSISGVFVLDYDSTMYTEAQTKDFVQKFVDMINNSSDFNLAYAQSSYGAVADITPTS